MNKPLKPQSIKRPKPEFQRTPVRDDDSLEVIHFPSKKPKVATDVTSNCNAMEVVDIPSNKPKIISDIILQDPIDLKTRPHRVPKPAPITQKILCGPVTEELGSASAQQPATATRLEAADNTHDVNRRESAEQARPSPLHRILPSLEEIINANYLLNYRQFDKNGKAEILVKLNEIDSRFSPPAQQQLQPNSHGSHDIVEESMRDPVTTCNKQQLSNSQRPITSSKMSIGTSSDSFVNPAPAPPHDRECNSAERLLASQISEHARSKQILPTIIANEDDLLGPSENFEGIPRNADRRRNETSALSSESSNLGGFRVCHAAEWCAEPNSQFTRFTAIPNKPRGNCLFHSIIKLMNFTFGPIELRKILLNSTHLQNCGDPAEATIILSSKTQFGDTDCLYVFSRHYNQNVCVHDVSHKDGIQYWHFRANDSANFIHIHFEGAPHYTPLLPMDENNFPPLQENASPPDEPDENAQSSTASYGFDRGFRNTRFGNSTNYNVFETSQGRQQRYADDSPSTDSDDDALPFIDIIANARPPREKPPWPPSKTKIFYCSLSFTS